MKMTLNKVKIERERWGKNEGKHKGVISFFSDHAEVEFNLTDDHIKRIFELALGRLTEVSQEISDELMADVIESMPRID